MQKSQLVSPLALTLSSPIEGCLGLICGGFIVTLVSLLLMKGKGALLLF